MGTSPKTRFCVAWSVTILGISYICAHVPMSPWARTSVPDEWFLIKVTEKWLRSVVTRYLAQ